MIELPPIKITGEYVPIVDIEETQPGIYFLYTEEKKLVYIGKASNIKTRIKQHISSRGAVDEVYKLYSYAKWTIMECPVDRDMYETWYINKLMPPINRNKTFTYSTSYYDYYNSNESEEQRSTRLYMESKIDKSMENFNL